MPPSPESPPEADTAPAEPAETETDWPFDADRDDPLTALRIPCVGTSRPRWNYIVAFDLDQIDNDGNRPDEHETALLKSFLDEYIAHWYNPRWISKMAERPFDIDGGANGYLFRKWGEGDWGYRQHSWRIGPTFWPGTPRYRERFGKGPSARAYSLLDLMDHIHSRGMDESQPSERWVEWKSAHPDVFGGAR